MALGAALEALSFGSVLGLFLVSKLLKSHSYISGINVHWDMFIVSIGTGMLSIF
jgi:hypothetical protein